MVSRDGFGSPVPRQPAHLHTQAELAAVVNLFVLNLVCFVGRAALTFPSPPNNSHFSPLTGGCSEGLGAFRFFVKNKSSDLIIGLRPFLTRKCFQVLFGLEGSKDFLENSSGAQSEDLEPSLTTKEGIS